MTDESGEHPAKHKRPSDRSVWRWALTHKKIYIPATALVAVLLATIPFMPRQDKTPTTDQRATIIVTNKISQQALLDIALRSTSTRIKTDKSGKAVITFPTGTKTLDITLSGAGYNDLKTTIQSGARHTFQLTPSGNIYFYPTKAAPLM